VEVTGNTLENNHNGVVVVGYDLDAKGLRPDNTVITGNTIINSGNTGIVTNGSTSVFSTATINLNDYRYSDTGGSYWVWELGSEYSWDRWRGFGNDLNGSFSKP
jgi:hypothetical protein